MSRKFLIAGNWKMNLTPDESTSLVEEINAVAGNQTSVQVCVCPPFTSLPVVSDKVEQTEVLLGAQNMHAQPSGAYTGEISLKCSVLFMSLMSSLGIASAANTAGRLMAQLIKRFWPLFMPTLSRSIVLVKLWMNGIQAKQWTFCHPRYGRG